MSQRRSSGFSHMLLETLKGTCQYFVIWKLKDAHSVNSLWLFTLKYDHVYDTYHKMNNRHTHKSFSCYYMAPICVTSIFFVEKITCQHHIMSLLLRQGLENKYTRKDNQSFIFPKRQKKSPLFSQLICVI